MGAVQFDEELDGGQAQGSGQKLGRGCATEKGSGGGTRGGAAGKEPVFRSKEARATW